MKTAELGNSLHTQQNAPVLCSKAVYICYDRLFSFSKAMFHKLFFSYNRFYLVENRFLSDENFFFLLFWHFTRLHVNLTRNAVFSFCHFFLFLFSYFSFDPSTSCISSFAECSCIFVVAPDKFVIHIWLVMQHKRQRPSTLENFVRTRFQSHQRAIYSVRLTFSRSVVLIRDFSVLFVFSLILMEFLFFANTLALWNNIGKMFGMREMESTRRIPRKTIKSWIVLFGPLAKAFRVAFLLS